MGEKYIRRSTATAARELDGETIVLSIPDSTLFSLNSTAGAIWAAADGRTGLRAIVDGIVAAFEVDAETAYLDALELVEELARHGIVEVADVPLVGAE